MHIIGGELSINEDVKTALYVDVKASKFLL